MQSSIGAKAFAVFTDQLGSEILAENDVLSEEVARLEQLHDHLAGVEIRVGAPGDGDYRIIPVSSGLDGASLNGIGRLLVVKILLSEEDAVEVPLAEFSSAQESGGRASLYVSNHRVASFPSSYAQPLVSEFLGNCSIRVVLSDSLGKTQLYGRIDGLSTLAYEFIRREVNGNTNNEGEAKSTLLGLYLLNPGGANLGDRLLSPDAKFVIEAIATSSCRMMKFKGRGVLANVLLAQRYRLLQYELKTEELMQLLRNISDKQADDDVEEQNRETKELVYECSGAYQRVRRSRKGLAAQFVDLGLDYNICMRAEEDHFRDLVHLVSNSSNQGALNKNRALKLRRHVLNQIKDRVGQFEIFYEQDNIYEMSEENEVCVSLQLSPGVLLNIGDGRLLWVVEVPPGIRIDADKLYTFQVCLSGMSLTNDRSNIVEIDGGDNLTMMCSSGFRVHGKMHFQSTQVRDQLMANQTFLPDITNQLVSHSIPRLMMPNDYESCKFEPLGLCLDSYHQETLQMLGLIDSNCSLTMTRM